MTVIFRDVDFSDLELPASAHALRLEVREFLADAIGAGKPARQLGHSSFDREFSRALGQRGWIGMTWPRRYGGHERSYLDRFVVTEELLAVAAPCSAHWVADRQSGPSLLRYGTEAQRMRFLPAIARGECCFAIGMSEPDSGSDLAAVRTRAHKVDGGWRVRGQKTWTSMAHLADAFFCLCRTSPDDGDRHAGLSQLIVDLHSPGVTIRPIRFLDGRHHFNEVFLDDVFVPDDMVLGEVGQGWKQVTSELALERSGPERFLTTYPLLVLLMDRLGETNDSRAPMLIGQLVARLYALRRMSLAIALAFSRGADRSTGEVEAPDLATEAALVKDLGTFFERDIIDAARVLVPCEPAMDADDAFERALAECITAAPVNTIRGGTTQILRTIVARRLERSAQ